VADLFPEEIRIIVAEAGALYRLRVIGRLGPGGYNGDWLCIVKLEADILFKLSGLLLVLVAGFGKCILITVYIFYKELSEGVNRIAVFELGLGRAEAVESIKAGVTDTEVQDLQCQQHNGKFLKVYFQ